MRSKLKITLKQVAKYTCVARNKVNNKVKEVRSQDYYVLLGKGVFNFVVQSSFLQDLGPPSPKKLVLRILRS